MKYILFIAALISISGCSKKDDLASQDSLLVAPHSEPAVSQLRQDDNGLVVDSFVTRQKPEMDTLKRLEPMRVVEIYDAYRPLRKRATTQAQLDSFLRSQKITDHELHAVLTEGDRLGWAGAPGH
jgi:hypothetical protein